MTDLHRAILSLGSNIHAESNLPAAMRLLRQAGQVLAVSSVWESESVGFAGPNFLNACALVTTSLQPAQFKEQIIRPIEDSLGRVRSAEKNAPRTIDIDLLLFDDQPLNTDFWAYAFVVVPLAELLPGFLHPGMQQPLGKVADHVRQQVWIQLRNDVSLI